MDNGNPGGALTGDKSEAQQERKKKMKTTRDLHDAFFFFFVFATGRDNQFVIKVILMQILYVAARSCSCSQSGRGSQQKP